MLLKVIILLVLSAYICEAKVVDFKDCGTPGEKLVSEVTITPCDKEPCGLIRGQNASIGINFKAKRNTNTATNICHGTIGPIPVRFPLDHPNACVGQGLHCPLVAGTPYKFLYSLPVNKHFPVISCVVKWEIKGDDGKDLVCVEMNVHLV